MHAENPFPGCSHVEAKYKERIRSPLPSHLHDLILWDALVTMTVVEMSPFNPGEFGNLDKGALHRSLLRTSISDGLMPASHPDMSNILPTANIQLA